MSSFSLRTTKGNLLQSVNSTPEINFLFDYYVWLIFQQISQRFVLWQFNTGPLNAAGIFGPIMCDCQQVITLYVHIFCVGRLWGSFSLIMPRHEPLRNVGFMARVENGFILRWERAGEKCTSSDVHQVKATSCLWSGRWGGSREIKAVSPTKYLQ